MGLICLHSTVLCFGSPGLQVLIAVLWLCVACRCSLLCIISPGLQVHEMEEGQGKTAVQAETQRWLDALDKWYDTGMQVRSW